jgi:GT2 family glycosyltransferase
MEQRLVSVVLVTWNSAEHLPRCLDGIARQTHDGIELIAVDNASSDTSVELLGPHGARVIRNDANRGFSAAVNQAIAVARGEFVLFLNPDCFLEPGYVATLVSALDEAGADFGSATGRLLKVDGSGIDSMGIRMTRSGRHLDIDDPAAGGEVFGVSGAAALHRLTFLRDAAIGGEVLDEDFFAYREDADLAWRGRLFGWRALCEPRAVAHHVRRVTPEVRKELPAQINMHSVKNRFLLRLKNEGLYLAIRNAPFELARDLVVIAAALTVERTSLPAFGWLWRNRARVFARRRAIQSRRRVSDRALARWFR